MLVAPIKQGEGAIEHESPTGLIRFHQHGWGLSGYGLLEHRPLNDCNSDSIPMRLGGANIN
jgi:hypothetical protein